MPGNVIAVDYSENNGSSFTTYYYLRNAQNDVVKLIDGSGNAVIQYTYDSWGKLLSTSGSLAETFGAEQPFRYRGYVYDEETGWYYLQSRYYNPEVGRFISADVYLSTGQGVLGHNAYAYCLNNPVNMSDECGCRASLAIIHDMIRDALADMFGLYKEVTINVNRFGKSGRGRIDLVDSSGGIYEIKPERAYTLGQVQISNYLKGNGIGKYANKFPDGFHEGTMQFEGQLNYGTILVEYYSVGCVICYTVDGIPGLPYYVYEPVPEKEIEKDWNRVSMHNNAYANGALGLAIAVSCVGIAVCMTRLNQGSGNNLAKL